VADTDSSCFWGSAAEHRKLLLLSFAILGSTSTTLFIALPSSSPVWVLCALLAIFAIVAFGASIVAMNAYLPSLARSSHEVREKAAIVERIRETTDDPSTPSADDEDEDDEPETGGGRRRDRVARRMNSATMVDPVLQGAIESYNEALSKSTSRISSRGIALGYGAGIALLCVALIPVTLLNGSTFSLRLAVSMSGVWWLLFSIPTAIWLPSGRAAASVGGLRWERGVNGGGWRNSVRRLRRWDDDSSSEDESGPSVWTQIKGAWIRLGQMLHPREMAKLRNTFWYLAAWFLLSDGT
jgi:MFS transporter, UMF1 family